MTPAFTCRPAPPGVLVSTSPGVTGAGGQTAMGVVCSVLSAQHPRCFCVLVTRLGNISLSLSSECCCRDNKINIWPLYLRGQRYGKCLSQGDVSNTEKNLVGFPNPSPQLPLRHKHHLSSSVSKTSPAKILFPMFVSTISTCRKAS